jgi:dTDP-4-dehydrorhamnose 3,5-epimerase
LIFQVTRIDGVVLLAPERLEDERGFFARIWCSEEAQSHGLDPAVAQCSLSHTIRRGTLRGMHYQAFPHAESKTVRCARGSVFDVVADLRPESPTYLQWLGFELTQENRVAVYVPKGCAHGFLTLTDDVELLYQISVPYAPGMARGFRWNDAAVGIHWPIQEPVLSERDASYPDIII